MNIHLHEIPIRDVVAGYLDSNEDGVIAYNGKLNVRPKYQREFIYKDAQRDAVIDTVLKKFPLNVMYWAKNENGMYEIIDGQQRTVSVCKFANGEFSYNKFYFHSLPKDKQEEFLDYKLMVYICEGTDSEKLDWFKTINIAGEELTYQELRNAIYTSEWLTNAKRYFSKSGCVAYKKGKDYMTGECIRQDYLEKVLDWISNGNIDEYMGKMQTASNASELWQYFQSVINWTRIVFTKYRKEMKGLPWGRLYNTYKNNTYNAVELEEKIMALMMDDDVSKKSGIYEYLLSGEEKFLNIRLFTPSMKTSAFEQQKGKCKICKKEFSIDEMEADHITPWSEGGKTVPENCQMLCRNCNRHKSDH